MKKMMFLYMLLSFLNAPAQSGQPNISKTIIEGEILDGRSDTLTLSFYVHRFGQARDGRQIFKTITKNGTFHFELPYFTNPVYITLTSSNRPKIYLENYLVESGDSISISVNVANVSKNKKLIHDGVEYSFSGKNSGKFQSKYSIDSLAYMLFRSIPIDKLTPVAVQQDIDNLFLSFPGKREEKQAKLLAKLAENKKNINPLIYEIMQSDILYHTLTVECASLSSEWTESFSHPDSILRRQKIMAFFNNHFENEKEQALLTEHARELSISYFDFLVWKTMLAAKIENMSKGLGDVTKLYPVISRSPLQSREKLITALYAYMRSYTLYLKNLDDFLLFAVSQVKDKQFAALLKEYQVSMLKGNSAYNFILPDKNGDMVSLEQFRGKVVFIDFWFTGCTACTMVARRLPEVENNFKKYADVVFVSINVDKDRNEWLESLKKGIYTIPENINLYTSGLGTEHPLIRFYHINGFPNLLLIDRAGKIYATDPPRPSSINGVQRLTSLIEEARQSK